MIINKTRGGIASGHILRIVAGISLLAILLLVSSAGATPYAYVTGITDIYNSGTVSVIDTATDNVTATVNVGFNPAGIAVNPSGTKIYVANMNSNNVSVIDTANNTVSATVPIGASPQGVAVNPSGTKVYVTNEGSNTASVIDTATNTVIATVPVGNQPYGIAVNPSGTKVYVANSGSNNVSVIDTATDTVTNTVPVGNQPYGIAVNPSGTKVYVANSADWNISVIDTANNTVSATVNVGEYPDGVAVNPSGTKVYVTNYGHGTVSVIDTANNTVSATVNVGFDPRGVAMNPSGTKVYVANSAEQQAGSNNVSVIDTATDTVTATINVGSYPWGVAVGPVGTPTLTPPTVHITANPATHDINVSTNFTFTANPAGSWGNNISYSWSIAYEKCFTAASVLTGQSIPEYLDVACGNATISVTAEDEKKNNASDTYLVTVHENATLQPTPTPTFNISGFKMNVTGSGVQGWNITLMNSTMQKIVPTGADGSYKFMNLVEGTYNVTEETQVGWTNVSPMSQQVTINGADIMNINFTNTPVPVILVHGLMEYKDPKDPSAYDWADVMRVGFITQAPSLAVEIFNYEGVNQDINESAKDLKKEIDDVKKKYNSTKVDIVGHSEGGIVARAYINNPDLYKNDVRKLVMIGSPNHGTDIKMWKSLGPAFGPTGFVGAEL